MLVIDADALNALRGILADEDPANYQYTTERLILALRDNRETVLYRNPMFQSSSIFAYPILFYGRGQTPTNKSNTIESHLLPEPGKRSHQALRYCRHWDSQQPVTVYKSAVVQTLTEDYTVDYPEGRVTFTEDVSDYEVVTASYCYYKIYHACRDVLSSSLASGANNLVSIRLGNDSFTTAPIRDQIAVMNTFISNMMPKTLAVGRKVY